MLGNCIGSWWDADEDDGGGGEDVVQEKPLQDWLIHSEIESKHHHLLLRTIPNLPNLTKPNLTKPYLTPVTKPLT